MYPSLEELPPKFNKLEWQREYRLTEKGKEVQRRWNQSEKGRLYKRAWKYGLTPEGLQDLFNAQEGKCAICEAEKSLDIDHDHRTGKVRGLLCRSCNNRMGIYDRQQETKSN